MSGGLGENPLLSSSIMFLPALVAIIVIILTEQWKGFSAFTKMLGLRVGQKKYIFLYPLVMFVTLVFIYLMTFFIFPNVFIPMSKLPEVLAELSIQFGTTSIFMQIIMIFFLNSVVGSIINIPLFLGEEIGWRSFLYPRLEKLYQKSFLIIGGVFWGIWHAPMILMGHNYPSTPILGLFMMTIFCIPVGIIFYYFYIKSGSIITVALCHGVLNQTASTIHMIFIDEQVVQPTIHGATGIIGILMFAAIALMVYRKRPVIEDTKGLLT